MTIDAPSRMVEQLAQAELAADLLGFLEVAGLRRSQPCGKEQAGRQIVLVSCDQAIVSEIL